MINCFKQKKLIEYLEPGKKVLIRFGHGWGDTQMFMPIYDHLKKEYKDVIFNLYVECGQEEIFNSVKHNELDEQNYDLIFSLNFPMAEKEDITKSAKCCLEEIGIQPITEVAKLPKKQSPFVCVHFQGTCLPHSVNCPENIAKEIWNEIKEFGKIPIECHFQHIFHNPVNQKYNFIDNSVRNYTANLHNLIGLIQHSYAFIGVASGPLVTALSVMPEKTLYLEKEHKIKTYTKKDIKTIRINNYKKGEVLIWLKNMQ